MRARLRWLVLLPALGLVSLALGQGVVVKGLTEGRAILDIDGTFVVLREGQSHQSIKLIKATNDEAVLVIGGKRHTMYLDSSIARDYQAPDTRRSNRTGTDMLYESGANPNVDRTTLLSVKLAEEHDNTVTLGIDYVYPGDYGDEVFFGVSTLSQGADTGFAQVSETKLLKGRHYAEINVTMHEDAPLVYVSEDLRVSVYWSASKQRQGDIATRVIPFEKYWKKVRIR